MSEITSFIYKNALETPNKTAILSKNGSISWHLFECLIQKYQDVLKDVRERIIMLSAVPEISYLVMYAAALREGKIVLPYSIKETENSIRSLKDELQGRIFNHQEYQKEILVSLDNRDLPKTLSSEKAIIKDIEAPKNIILSSGSTGVPKKIVHSLLNHYESAKKSVEFFGLNADDHYLLSLPLNHVGGQAVFFRSLVSKATMVLPDTASDLTELLKKDLLSCLSLVPTQLFRLLKYPSNPLNSNRLKWILLGGAPLNDELKKELHKKVPNLRLYMSYGLTETASGACIATLSLTNNEVIGKPLPNWELAIFKDGERFNFGTGEILIKGPSLALGYLKNHKIDPIVDENGFFHSRDLGILDANGVKILGRIDNQFISGGENIIPEAIENELLKIEGVLKAVVVPIPDPEWGAITAVVMLTDKGYQLTDIQEKAKNSMNHIKLPKIWLPWDSNLDQSLKIKRKSVISYAKALLLKNKTL